MIELSLQNIAKSYDKKNFVLNDISFEVFEDEFLVLVGPSGSGKTTLLRMIAGLEDITQGSLFINQVLQNNLDPKERNLNFVFQNYALIPNLTVFDNIQFGLSNKLSKLVRHQMTLEVAEKLGLKEKLGRYPSQLSGGERQRVALARSLVDGKELILFDEPLSNLDAKLRAYMRKELIFYQRTFGVTALYVTHDQIEALSMSSRVVFIDEGRIIQIGTPYQMYHRPSHVKTLQFIGKYEPNILKGMVKDNVFETKDLKIPLKEEVQPFLKRCKNQVIYYGIRAEDVKVSKTSHDTTFQGKISIHEKLGDQNLYHISYQDDIFYAITDLDFKVGETVFVTLDHQKYFFDGEGRRLLDQQDTIIHWRGLTPNQSDKKVLRELKNYGYSIQMSQSKDDLYIQKNENDYECMMHGEKHTLKHLYHILKYSTYQKR